MSLSATVNITTPSTMEGNRLINDAIQLFSPVIVGSVKE